MKEELKKVLNEYRQLLKPVHPSFNLQIKRLKEIECDIVLPIKWILILILVYYLFFSQLLAKETPFRETALHFIQSYFIFYILFNAVLSVFLLTNRRNKLIKIRGVLFLNGFFDAILLAILTLITGGYSSMLYWLFVGLMLRNTLVHPVAREQLSLNIIICLLYVSAGTLDIKIRDMEKNAYITVTEAELGIPPRFNNRITNKHNIKLKEDINLKEDQSASSESHFSTGLDENTLRSLDLLPPDNPEPVLLRTVLLILFAICFYGLQILLLKSEMATKERQLFESKSEQLQATSRIAAEIAHQIKNPLAIINNSAFILQRTLKDTSDSIKQQIEIIREEVVKADKIVTDLLGYAALAEGRVKKLDVIKVLEASIETVFPPRSGFDVVINKTYKLKEAPVMMQENHLKAIFVNILQNARDAINNKGILDIIVQKDENDKIEISITDTGPGIEPDKINKIFEPYFTTKATGTGLGLAIVRQNLDIYGGTVKVESHPGKGARFIVILPTVTYETGE